MVDDLPGILISLVAVLGLVLANGFFVAAEFALVSVRRTRIDELVAQGVGAARSVQRAFRDLDRYIAGTQVGVTIASLALGWIGEPAIVELIEPLFRRFQWGNASSILHTIAIVVSFCLITFLHVVLGELVPKSLALQRSERISLWVGRPMAVLLMVLRPLIWALSESGNFILRLLGVAPAGEHHGVHSVDELEILVRQSHAAGVLDDLERQMLHRAFRFSELSASDIMIPRLDIVALDATKPIEQILDKVAQSIHSRLPLYDGTIDQLLGIVYLPDLFKALRSAPTKPLPPLRELARPAMIVPEAMHLDALLEQFRQRRTQIAIVVDEYGTTAGLLTVEDIVEEVFGELQDALEAEQPKIQRLPDGRILVRGEVRLDELNELLGWELIDEDADTIAGYVMNRLGRVARLHDVVETAYGRIRVANMARMRITQVAVLPKEAPAAVAGA